MIKVFAAAISALAFVQIATPAAAQSGAMADRRIEMLLRQLATKESSRAMAAPITLAAAVRVTGTIQLVSAVKLPLFCSVQLFGDN